MNFELNAMKYTESQGIALQSLKNMLADTTVRYRTFLFVGEVGNGKSFLARKFSKSRGYDYINIVDQLDEIYNKQNLKRMKPEWLVRYLDDLTSKSDALVVIFDELDSIILLKRDPLPFIGTLLRIIDKKDFGKGIVMILSTSENSYLPSLKWIKKKWFNSRKLVTLSLRDIDTQIIAKNCNVMWTPTHNSFDIVKRRLWRYSDD
jgi:hypothetical protein